MASGQQIAEANFHRFSLWLASKTDDDFRQFVNIVGDEAAVKAAVEAPPKAELRSVGLAQFLMQEIIANFGTDLMSA